MIFEEDVLCESAKDKFVLNPGDGAKVPTVLLHWYTDASEHHASLCYPK